MTAMRDLAVATALLALTCAAARAQTAAVEVTQSAGGSTESIVFAGAQVRALGELAKGVRLVAEASWGRRTRTPSDVFGTAYPYGGRIDVIEAYAEWVGGRGGLRAIRAGRYRTPFGLSSASDHAYLGFLRPPLVRYGEYYALSAGYLEHGVDVLAGASRVSLELSASRPADVGDAIRRSGTTTAARVEATFGPAIVGASRVDTTPYLPESFARGRARYTGVDLRAMVRGVQVRGEWLDGQPFDGPTTAGGYLDLIVHTRRMNRVTALARIETLDYDTASRFALRTQRATAAARVRLWQGLALSAGVAGQQGQRTQRRSTAFDVGITWTLRRDLSQPTP
ncbi:MAG: hypothetical protein R2712_25905 [Vicinamibacterales bacterium]